jgi:putative salt-induced outer membrane protein YdiY
LGLALTIPGEAAAQQTLVLTNGDRVTGTLHKIDGTTWVVKYLDGEIKIPAAQVQTFTTTTPLGLRLNDGTIGVLDAAYTRMEIRKADGTTVAFELGGIAAVGPADDLDKLRVVHIGLFSPISRFWSATAAVGFSNQKGNSRARGTSAGFEIERKTTKDRLTLQGGMSRESSQPPGGVFEQTVDKYFGLARVDIYVSTALFAYGAARLERDRFQDLELRSTYDAGLGLQIISTPRTDLRVSAGGGYQSDNYYTAPTSSGPVLALDGALKQQVGPIRFAWQVSWTPKVDSFSDYHLRSHASLTANAFKGLGMRLALLDEYTSEPLPGVEKHDQLVALALTYSIGK